MDTGTVSLFILCVFSLAGNALLYFQFQRRNKDAPKSYELREFIADLMQGDALVRVTRVDPADVLLRSPRERRL